MRTPSLDHPAPPIGHLSRTGVVSALLAGGCAVALASYHTLSTSKPSADYVSLGGNLREIAFFTYLVSSVVAVGMVRRAGMATRTSERLITVGYTTVALGVAAGFALREDPTWFVFLGGPGNLIAIIGWITLGATSARQRLLPKWLALLAAIGGVFAVVLAEFGSQVLIGCFWLHLAWRSHVAGARPGTR